MKYQVFQNDKPCAEYGIKGWDVDTFKTKREAEIFAYHWAYPYGYDECVKTAPPMEIGKPYDYSMTSEASVLMTIKEIPELPYQPKIREITERDGYTCYTTSAFEENDDLYLAELCKITKDRKESELNQFQRILQELICDRMYDCQIGMDMWNALYFTNEKLKVRFYCECYSLVGGLVDGFYLSEAIEKGIKLEVNV